MMMSYKRKYINNGVNISKPTIEEIPKEISQIIYNDNKKHIFKVYYGYSMLGIITCLVYSSKRHAERHNLSARTGFYWSLQNVYKYMAHYWENKPVELDFRRVYSFFKDLLLGKNVEIEQTAIYHFNQYFKGLKDEYEVYIDTEYLLELRTELKMYDEYENVILTKTDETMRILKKQRYSEKVYTNICALLTRLRIEDKHSENFIATYFYYYGVIMGKREERLKRTRGKANV